MQQQSQHEQTENEAQSTPASSFSTSDKMDSGFGTSTENNILYASKSKQNLALAQVIQYRKQAKARYTVNLITGLLFMTVSLLSSLFLSADSLGILLPFFILGSIAFSLVMFALTLSQMRSTQKTIAAIDDISMIGPLAEAWSAERFLKPKPIVAALCRLLPRLQASDAHLLTREQRTCLYHAINWRAGRPVYQYDRKLTVAILKALQQIGDKEALPFVRRAALSMHKDVREAANDCLRFLVEQAEQHKHGAQLLRPADARTSSPDVLLRASTCMTPQQQTPPDQLLRAHNQE